MFLFAFLGSLFAGEYADSIVINKSYYTRDSFWELPPDILVCNDSDIGVATIKKAIKIWEKEGEKTGKIILEKSGQVKCIEGYQEGYIKFTNFKNNFSIEHYDAMSLVYWEKKSYQDKKYAKSGIIETTKDAKGSLSITVHELGHSFGFDHCEIIGDIMSY